MDCTVCHGDLAQGKVVHAALQMGCQGCHTGVDAANIPHKFQGRKGLSAQPPDLCFQCHSKEGFTKKIQHAPVAGGMCLSCHKVHSGPNKGLLKAPGNALCRECHAGVLEKPHVMTDRLPQGHPLAGRKDPVRERKPFECASCHEPHSSDWGSLFRYEAQDAKGLCKHCHEFLQ